MGKSKLKKIIISISIVIGLTSLPILIGFLCAHFIQKPNYFETITTLFSLAYLFVFLIKVARKDNLVYRKGKYKSKEEYKESDSYQSYKKTQLILLISCLILVISSLIIFFTYVKK